VGGLPKVRGVTFHLSRHFPRGPIAEPPWAANLTDMKPELRPNLIVNVRRIAGGWLVVGSLLFIFAAVAATAHYGFGMPVHEAHTNRDATPEEIAITFGALLAGGALFALAGITLLRWLPPR